MWPRNISRSGCEPTKPVDKVTKVFKLRWKLMKKSHSKEVCVWKAWLFNHFNILNCCYIGFLDLELGMAWISYKTLAMCHLEPLLQSPHWYGTALGFIVTSNFITYVETSVPATQDRPDAMAGGVLQQLCSRQRQERNSSPSRCGFILLMKPRSAPISCPTYDSM